MTAHIWAGSMLDEELMHNKSKSCPLEKVRGSYLI